MPDNTCYFPAYELVYDELRDYRFYNPDMLHPSDRGAFSAQLDPDKLQSRLENSPNPGVLSAEYRYRSVEGGWIWTRQVMVAGARIEDLQGKLGAAYPVIRIMPNTPVSIGEGMILYSCSPEVTEEQKNAFLHAMRNAGRFQPVEERLMEAGMAVSGCGPAFVDLFVFHAPTPKYYALRYFLIETMLPHAPMEHPRATNIIKRFTVIYCTEISGLDTMAKI